MNERFAPSPTGPLHLGHAFSAISAWNNAVKAGGDFLLRIEDIDQSRARPKWEQMIYDDLRWLGLDWPKPVIRQSDRMETYAFALNDLWARGLLYPCACRRRDIQNASQAPQEGAPLLGPDGLIYPGTCRAIPVGDMPEGVAIRLNMRRAISAISGAKLTYTETGERPGVISIPKEALITSTGDVVLARKDIRTSYHLSVVLDDAAQKITQVTRGEDLRDATPVHVLLQCLLDLPTPTYDHHRLIRDDRGKRLAKRDDAKAIFAYRNQGATPGDIYEMVGITPLARR